MSLCISVRSRPQRGGVGNTAATTLHVKPLAEREQSCERGAAPLFPAGVIPVDQLCNSTKLEHYRWSGSISDAYRDRREKTNTVLKGEEENRKTLSDKRHGAHTHTHTHNSAGVNYIFKDLPEPGPACVRQLHMFRN